MTYELRIAELDKVSGGTTIEEANALMAKWNAAITAAGQAGIENAGMFGPMPKPPSGGCPGQPSHHH
jgi:hypothetical protein